MHHNYVNPLCLLSEKREQERGSRQQDLRQQGLGKAGAGTASMNQQPTTHSKSKFLQC